MERSSLATGDKNSPLIHLGRVLSSPIPWQFLSTYFLVVPLQPPAFLIMFLNRTKATEVFRGIAHKIIEALRDRICFSSVPKFSNSSASSRAAVSDRAVHV